MRTMYPIDLPEDWTANQALAVFEFLDDIKEHIGHVYGADIVERYRKKYGADKEELETDGTDE